MSEAMSKVATYLEAGVRLVWLIDPASLTVTVFRPDAAPRTLAEDDVLDGGDALPGFAVPLAEVFH
jgi:Uma2 family endonuclease